MSKYRFRILLVTVAAIGVGSAKVDSALGQLPPVQPAPPVPTVWQKLGIPQTYRRLRDGSTNRRGNFPGAERKPPLKAIADPANLESPNDAIKAAAEIKQEEDLKQQKIKALKYLATIGCGCYDADGKVEKAILAGLNDCTPEVRMAAIEAVVYLVDTCDPQAQFGYEPTFKDWRREHCPGDEFVNKLRMMGVGKKCKELIEKERAKKGRIVGNKKCQSGCGPCAGCCTHCCSFKVQERLAEMAFGEKNGCFIEPVADIRAAAGRALCACPAPACPDEEEPEKEPEPEDPDKPEPPPRQPPAEGVDQEPAEGDDDDAEGSEDSQDDSPNGNPEALPLPNGQTKAPDRESRSMPLRFSTSDLPMSDAARVRQTLARKGSGQRARPREEVVPTVYIHHSSADDRELGDVVSGESAKIGDLVAGYAEIVVPSKMRVFVVTNDCVNLTPGSHVALSWSRQARVTRLVGRIVKAESGRYLLVAKDRRRLRNLMPGAKVSLRVLSDRNVK